MAGSYTAVPIPTPLSAHPSAAPPLFAAAPPVFTAATATVAPLSVPSSPAPNASSRLSSMSSGGALTLESLAHMVDQIVRDMDQLGRNITAMQAARAGLTQVPAPPPFSAPRTPPPPPSTAAATTSPATSFPYGMLQSSTVGVPLHFIEWPPSPSLHEVQPTALLFHDVQPTTTPFHGVQATAPVPLHQLRVPSSSSLLLQAPAAVQLQAPAAPQLQAAVPGLLARRQGQRTVFKRQRRVLLADRLAAVAIALQQIEKRKEIARENACQVSAAVRLQAAARGHLARHWLQEMRRQMLEAALAAVDLGTGGCNLAPSDGHQQSRQPAISKREHCAFSAGGELQLGDSGSRGGAPLLAISGDALPSATVFRHRPP